jgi:hypothetical protein
LSSSRSRRSSSLLRPAKAPELTPVLIKLLELAASPSSFSDALELAPLAALVLVAAAFPRRPSTRPSSFELGELGRLLASRSSSTGVLPPPSRSSSSLLVVAARAMAVVDDDDSTACCSGARQLAPARALGARRARRR